MEERDGAEDGRASDNTLGLSLEEFANRLRVGGEDEGLVILESGSDVVVVAVEPFHHFLHNR